MEELQKKEKKTSEPKAMPPMTRREATRGKIVRLPTAAKRVAALIPGRSDRSHYITLQLDIVANDKEARDAARSKRAAKDTAGMK